MSETTKIRVLIVDDHEMVCDGLQVFLGRYDDIHVVGTAHNGREALDKCEDLAPDVVLMDMVMPEMNGPAAISRLQKTAPAVQVIALTSFDEQQLVHDAIAAGAIGFLFKDVRADRLADAIRAAASGRSTLDPLAAQALISDVQRSALEVGEDLTRREREVLALLVAGRTNRQIAQALTIAEATVRLHVSNILGKLGASNRTEAVSIAYQHDLVSN
jgi:NarL family two-component system response regulator LiaR